MEVSPALSSCAFKSTVPISTDPTALVLLVISIYVPLALEKSVTPSSDWTIDHPVTTEASAAALAVAITESPISKTLPPPPVPPFP